MQGINHQQDKADMDGPNNQAGQGVKGRHPQLVAGEKNGNPEYCAAKWGGRVRVVGVVGVEGVAHGCLSV
jgi:hypothetical protein